MTPATDLVWHAGTAAGPSEAARLVEAFREASSLVAGLVLPWNRPATVGDLDLDPAETTLGMLWSSTAECRWRIEGDLAVATVISDEVIDLPDSVASEVEVDDSRPIIWQRAPFLADGGVVSRAVERTYTDAQGPLLRRVHIQEA